VCLVPVVVCGVCVCAGVITLLGTPSLNRRAQCCLPLSLSECGILSGYSLGYDLWFEGCCVCWCIDVGCVGGSVCGENLFLAVSLNKRTPDYSECGILPTRMM
jgi:hypothetical protein